MTARGENDSRRNGVPNVTDPSQAEAHVHADAPDLKMFREDWRSRGGDDIRTEFEEALKARENGE